MTNKPLLVCGFLALTACSHKEAPPAPQPPEVGVVALTPGSVTLTTELPGRTVAYRVAEVRPQVGGVILKRLFVEGSEVKQGQQLYQIDPAPFRASLQSAQASLARAQATLVSAKLLAERYKPLASAHAVSQQSLDNAVASQDQAAADVASAKASVETAQINLTYTRVLAPISGRTGRSAVTEGALVSTTQTTALVVVQQLDPIYVDVTQPSAVLLRLKRAQAAGRIKSAGNGEGNVQLTLEDDSSYAHAGKLQFAEVTVDSGTGTVTLRAVFPNPDRLLLPGMFVHERIEEGVTENALLIPQQAVTRNQRGDPTVLTVGSDNKVATRIIKTDRAIGTNWLVTDGVAQGERVVVVGLQRVTPATKEVRPQELTPQEAENPPANLVSPPAQPAAK